ncbi:MAG: nucleoside triphosphate pyrophosphohydrolase [Rhodospirillaceae bacterium TMED8]|nr:nucleoside triphosphate pyrophosphohydrolase [Magnetovibrio sp.]OUT52029.1 MAG: nucleoside triphosphate pyrophosphohydrolase [Rhodospirillaceae bacterium TMED8]
MSLHTINKLLQIMAKLRDPVEGCPWDLKQTFETIIPYMIEEVYEVADAVDRADRTTLKEELGDLLFQVVFHSQMASEINAFNFSDVVTAITDKMIRRHPHVFADMQTQSIGGGEMNSWEDIKAAERKNKANANDQSVLADIPIALPALIRAEKLQKRASGIGFDWPNTERVMEKVREEVDEVEAELVNGLSQDRLKDEIGDLMFVCVNLARKIGIDPETALRAANAKFEKRFRLMETDFSRDANGYLSGDLEEMEAAWQLVKQKELKN